MVQAWERQHDEPPKAFAAFIAYLELGSERSLRALEAVGVVTVSFRQMTRWCSDHAWVARSAAWDDHQAQLVRDRLDKRRLDMADRQSTIARKMQDKVQAAMGSLRAEDLTPQDAARWLDVAVKVERLALGEPTEIGKQEITMPKVLEVTLDDSGEAPAASGTDEGVEEH